MKTTKINTKELALFYDGEDFYFGKFNPHNCQFVSIGAKGADLSGVLVNVDFLPEFPSIMVLKDAIEENVYGEDRNLGLENAGLDMEENRFLNAFYAVGEVDKQAALRYQYFLNRKIKTRWSNYSLSRDFFDARRELENKLENSNENSSERE